MPTKMDQFFREYKKQYPPGAILFGSGEEGADFYIIQEGVVEISKESDDKGRTVLSTLGPGEIIGEMALISKKSKRSATAIACTELTCFQFSKKKLDHLIETSGEFRDRLMNLLCERIRKANSYRVRVRDHSDLIYKAALLLWYVVDQKNWYGPEEKSIKLNPNLSKSSRQFDIPENKLELFLTLFSDDNLSEIESDYRQQVSNTALSLFKNILRKFNLSSYYADNYPLDKSSRVKFGVESAAENAKNLFLSIKDYAKDLSQKQYMEIKEKYNVLNDFYEDVKEDPDIDEIERSQLGAYLRGLQRIFSSIQPEDLK